MQTNDEILWMIAKKRASFKKSLISYIIVCSFLWAVWFMSGRHESRFDGQFDHSDGFVFPWPIWVMLWWGVALVFCFVKAYVINGSDTVQKEYKKLKNQQ